MPDPMQPYQQLLSNLAMPVVPGSGQMASGLLPGGSPQPSQYGYRGLLASSPAAQGMESQPIAPQYGYNAPQRPVPLWFGGKPPVPQGTAAWASPQQNSFYPQLLALLQNPLLLQNSTSAQPLPQLPIGSSPTGGMPGQAPAGGASAMASSGQGAAGGAGGIDPAYLQLLQQMGLPIGPQPGSAPFPAQLPSLFAPYIDPATGQWVTPPITPGMIPKPTPGVAAGVGTTIPAGVGTQPLPQLPAQPAPLPGTVPTPSPTPTPVPKPAARPRFASGSFQGKGKN